MSVHYSDSDSEFETNKTSGPVSFYFQGLQDNKHILDKDSAKNYIILQNDNLHQKTETLATANKKLIAKIRELEDEVSSLESGKSNLRHYVKNFNELSNYHKDLVAIYDNHFDKTVKNTINYKNKLFFMFLVVQIVFLCKSLIQLNPFEFSFSWVVLFTFIYNHVVYMSNIYNMVSSQNNFIKKFKDDLKNDPKVIRLRQSISEAHQGNKYLDELIDNF